MSSPLTLAARLLLDPQGWGRGLGQAQARTKGFSSFVRREFSELRSFMDSTGAKLASYGAGFALGASQVKSAGLDKTLAQIGLTASEGRTRIRGLRGELFGMAAETGRSVDDLQAGFSTLIAGGQRWNEAMATLPAINRTMAVTGAQAETLAGTLGVASTAFRFDLSNPTMAQRLLDKMTVAGRKGNAELENLGGIFSRVGVNASRAGFGFDQTLAFIEGLSMIERQPERLATLADSTLRLFTNAKYMAEAQKASGVKFFEGGARRDPLKVLADLKTRMDAFKTDAQREAFLSKAFGNADLDTIKGLSTLLQGNSLDKIGEFTKEIGNASGTIERDLPKAIANAVDQTGRLKARLRDAADAFAQPINAVFTKLAGKVLDSKEDGGLGLSNGQLIGGGLGALGGAYIAKRMLGGIAGRLFGGAASLGTGVAMGTALEKAGAATPVFVVGAAPGVFSGAAGIGGTATGAVLGGAAARRAPWLARLALMGGSSVGSLATAGAAGLGSLAAGVGVAGVAGYGAGKLISDHAISGTSFGDSIGRSIAKALAFFGNKEAQDALKLDLNVKVDGGTATVSARGPMFRNVVASSRTSDRTGRMTSGGGR